ncbi:unnamed protein product [Bemisia tabaci]|uniref:Uncharacterized protein n=1 Tax=Bemisia tabaci TaxID=7038 RepID=A0A9P0F7A2_BEMTA|nr:unnamed protein product [Bemisia tabaci]
MNTDTIIRFEAIRSANFPWLLLTGFLKPHELVNLYLAIGWAIDEALLAPVTLYNKLPRRILRNYSSIINWKAASLSYKFTSRQLRRYADRIDWCLLSRRHEFTREDLLTFRNRVCWFWVSCHDTLDPVTAWQCRSHLHLARYVFFHMDAFTWRQIQYIMALQGTLILDLAPPEEDSCPCHPDLHSVPMPELLYGQIVPDFRPWHLDNPEELFPPPVEALQLEDPAPAEA